MIVATAQKRTYHVRFGQLGREIELGRNIDAETPGKALDEAIQTQAAWAGGQSFDWYRVEAA